MKYSDLVQFEPIESVIQLRDADSLVNAQKLVETYVMSDSMVERIKEQILPNLQFQEPKDNMGLLIVGNYGTGKSHLMSVISAVAEHSDLVKVLRNPKAGAEIAPIAGKFKVIRVEIGAVTMPLRDILCQKLTERLKEMGVEYHFPPSSEVTDNKDLFMAFANDFFCKPPTWSGFSCVRNSYFRP